MELIKIGEYIINMRNVLYTGREDGVVYVCFNDKSGTLEFFGKQADELWQRLTDIEKGGRV